MYQYSVWVIDSKTEGELYFLSPKLDFKKGDVIELDESTFKECVFGFNSNTIYEFEIHKVVWRSLSESDAHPYHVAELQVVYVTNLGVK